MSVVPTLTSASWRQLVRTPAFWAYAAAVGPLLFFTVRVIAAGWYPEGDAAVIGLKSLAIGDGQLPLLGQWTTGSGVSQLEVPHHPGPIYYYLLAPILLLTGGAPWGLILASAAVVIGAVVLLIAQTRIVAGDRIALLVGFGLLYFVVWNGTRLVTPWNPWPMAFGLPVAALLTIRLFRREWKVLPLWLFVIAVVVQSHASGVYPAVALCGFAGWAIVRAVAGDRVFPVRGSVSRIPYRVAALSVLVALLCWLPVLIEIAVHSPDNVDAMIAYATSGEIPRLGWPRAIEAISGLLGGGPGDLVLGLLMGYQKYLSWAAGDTGAPFVARLVVFLLRPGGLAVVAAIALAVRSLWIHGWTLSIRREDRTMPVVVTGVAMIASVFSLAQADTSGPAGPFRVFYNTVSAPILVLLAGLVARALLPILRERRPALVAWGRRNSRAAWAKVVLGVVVVSMLGLMVRAEPLAPAGVRGDEIAALTETVTEGESSVRILTTARSDFALAPMVYALRASGKSFFFEPHFLWYDSDFAAHDMDRAKGTMPAIGIVSTFDGSPAPTLAGQWTEAGAVPREMIFELPAGRTIILRGK